MLTFLNSKLVNFLDNALVHVEYSHEVSVFELDIIVGKGACPLCLERASNQQTGGYKC